MRYDTWYEIKLKTFQKMFAINNGSTQLPTDMMGKDYENAMPAAANEALQLLATAGKFIIKSIDIAHIPVKSLIQNSERIRSIERGTITYEADGAFSAYYERKGKGTMTVSIGDETPVVTEFDDTASKGYVSHKLLFDRHNVSDTEFDNSKLVNKIVIENRVNIVIAELEDCSNVSISNEYTNSPYGIFEVLETQGKYQIIYSDKLFNVDDEVFYRCTYTYTPDGGTATSTTIATHQLVGIPAIKPGTGRISFTSDYPLSLKNVALYSADYENVDDIPPYSEYVRYDLRELAPDYYMVDPEGIIYEGNREVSRYMATSDWFEEGYNILLLKRDMPGNYKIYYKAYPQEITLTTPNDTELVLYPEVAALLPLYMASQVYKDDDLAVATVYRNEFEVAFERLVKNVEAPSQEHFVSITGWI